VGLRLHDLVEGGRPAVLHVPPLHPGAHPPIPDPEFAGKTKRGNFADLLVQMDTFTGVILDKLGELGVADETIVVWSADNGPDPTYRFPAMDPDPLGPVGRVLGTVARRLLHVA
jgi:arylsulfatase A-like enzyme